MTTRDKIVELGRNFVQAIGYHAFKYQQIATELNIKNASIHHYFPNKEDLGVAIIEKDKADFQEMIRQLKEASPIERTEALLEVYNRFFKEGKNLCIIGSCCSAYQDIPERMQNAAKIYLEELSAWLTKAFKDGLASGEFHFTSKPEDLSAFWTATLPGSLQGAQIRGAHYLNQVFGQLRKTYQQ